MTTQLHLVKEAMGPEHPDLNKERVELFLAALESGDYTKYAGSLRRIGPHGVRYCALGVATKVALDNGLGEEIDSNIIKGRIWGTVVLDARVAAWYGFDDSDPRLIDSEPNEGCVSGINDADADHSFWDIAQMGRARWLKDQG